jgi:hypothetical protein
MTVQQLIDRLREFQPDMEVKAVWDDIPDWDVNRVELYDGTVLIDVSACDSYEYLTRDKTKDSLGS